MTTATPNGDEVQCVEAVLANGVDVSALRDQDLGAEKREKL